VKTTKIIKNTIKIMKFLRYIDKKITFASQKRWLMSYLFIGIPISYLFTQTLMIVSLGWSEYKLQFDIVNPFIVLFFNLLIISPFIINYFIHTKKYNNLKKHFGTDKEVKVKSLFDFDTFVKGESYIIYSDSFMFNSGMDKRTILLVSNYTLKNIVNRFELDDIKEQRLKKLKKLKRKYF